MKTKVLWLSRHPMGDDQLTDLAHELKVAKSDIEVVTKNVTWAASADAAEDLAMNKETWKSLWAEAGRGGIIAGVFPPVASRYLQWHNNFRVRPGSLFFCFSFKISIKCPTYRDQPSR